jgi:phosphatidate cytidylyltransferase
MAMNWSAFKVRVLTAVFFVAVMLVGLLTTEWMFFIVFSVIHFKCWIEYQQLMKRIFPNYLAVSPFHHWAIMLAGWCLMCFATSGNLKVGVIDISETAKYAGVLLIIAIVLGELFSNKRITLNNLWISGVGFLYISVSWSMLIHIRSGALFMPNPGSTFFDFFANVAHRKGYFIPVVVVSSIWINDTMAYIIGSFVGKTPLNAFSPKKTWEGTIGGLICSVGAISIFSAIVLKDDWRIYFILTTVSVIAGTFGDLLESRIKRVADVKDSGNSFPGHGGFLDRFDSLLLAVPSVWLFLVAYSFITQIL